MKISFWMCGHNGPPNEPDRKLNFARLVLEDGTEVARSYPPRNDIAKQFDWNLTAWAGKRGHVEIVDGTTDLDGFAWLAVGRFAPEVISAPNHPVGDAGSVVADLYRLAGQLKLEALLPEVKRATGSTDANLVARLGATEALVMLEPEAAVAPFRRSLAMPACRNRRASRPRSSWLGSIGRMRGRHLSRN